MRFGLVRLHGRIPVPCPVFDPVLCLFLKFTPRQAEAFAPSQAQGDRTGGTGIDASPAGETVRQYRVFLFEDGLHDRGGAGLVAGLTGDTGGAVDPDFEDGELFENPSHQAERTEKGAPWAVDEQARREQHSQKGAADPAQMGRLENFEWVDGRNDVQAPGQGDRDQGREKQDPNSIGEPKGRFPLPNQTLAVPGVPVRG